MILLSHIIDTDTPTYGNRDKFILEETSCVADGASANSSKWTFSSNHLGTHIDMPNHFFDDGKTLTEVPLDFWYSDRVQLVEVPCNSAKLIEINDLTEDIKIETEVLLIKTGYEKYRKTEKYWNDNPGLSADFGEWVRINRAKIRIIGFDFISLTSWKYRDEGKKAHSMFLNPNGLGNPICLIEDIALQNYNNQIKRVTFSPIFVRSSNGAPITIFGFK